MKFVVKIDKIQVNLLWKDDILNLKTLEYVF